VVVVVPVVVVVGSEGWRAASAAGISVSRSNIVGSRSFAGAGTAGPVRVDGRL